MSPDSRAGEKSTLWGWCFLELEACAAKEKRTLLLDTQ